MDSSLNMNSYISTDLSFLPSHQETIATAEPLSADFLKYQLSRTPTLRRFSRNANRAPRAHLDAETPRNKSNLSLTKTDFRSASELVSQDDWSPRVAKRWPVPKPVAGARTFHEGGSVDSTSKSSPDSDGNLQMLEKPYPRCAINEPDDFTLTDAIREAAVSKRIEAAKDAIERGVSGTNVQKHDASISKTHAAVAQSSRSPAEKAVLKRPTNRHPLPFSPPLRQQRAALAEVQLSRQFSIPDDEKPATAKKQKRPRIARNLPVDELELAEERLVLPYDAPPICEWMSETTDWLFSNISKQLKWLYLEILEMITV